MEKAKVYFTDFRTKANGDGLPTKLKNLIKKAGLADLDLDGKFVAIKMHFGELGNISYLRPNYARAVVDVVKELGGRPFLTDCNTLYPGSRKNALEHLYCAWENGFTPLTVGCPILIGDGLKGTDDVAVPVVGGEYVKEARIGRAVMDADIVISLNHFKGHEATGFGGALKNLGMGCGSRAGKMEQHNAGKPFVKTEKCIGCGSCATACQTGGEAQIAELTALGFDKCPICVAKTQYSFSDDMTKLGAPEGFTVTVKNVKVSAGAGFVVVLTGDIMTMPGLPKVPAAEKIDVDANGTITGLF